MLFRSNLRYWLENILAPSTIVAENYRVTAFLTSDGQVISGVPVSQNKESVTVQTAQNRIVLRTDEILQRKPSELSLMPEGLLEGMTIEQKGDLFRFLMSDSK